MRNMSRTAFEDGGHDILGIRIKKSPGSRNNAAESMLRGLLHRLGLEDFVRFGSADGSLECCLAANVAQELVPKHDTLQLAATLSNQGDSAGSPNVADDRLKREIVLAMLAAPHGFEYPSLEEFTAAISIRHNIATTARKTALCFDPRGIERPEDCWTYHEETSFTLIPGQPLIPSLEKATQPELTGKCYSFSCYRATEYVILLGIAKALEEFNPELLQRLQQQWETRAIMSGRFHDVFLHEYGSMDTPLPARYYVPGDRVWFRNPDACSSDVSGYEGSWVIYMGGGLFTNFWKREQPYTLADKCLEIYHWRHATRHDDAGELQIDEEIVASRVQASKADAEEHASILGTMLRYRDAQGIYATGGCIDTTRECPRRVCPGTAEIMLPVVF
ncbi:MAG: hypothetical protein QG619_202 [Pseudomonadota bacterium]|jgi:hypothetical protein|nr:hypothetical protein [Pseudomonadota bacterium]